MAYYTINGLDKANSKNATKLIAQAIEDDPEGVIGELGPDGGWPDPDTACVLVGDPQQSGGSFTVTIRVSYEERLSVGCDAMNISGSREAKAEASWSLGSNELSIDCPIVTDTDEPPDDYDLDDPQSRADLDYENSEF